MTSSPLPSDIKLRRETMVEHPLEWHYKRESFSDHVAYAAAKFLRFFADAFFKERYGHRAVILETVAAVPGMVGAAFNHLHSLRGLKGDNGRIRLLLDEAENERMHLMTFLEISKPTRLDRYLITTSQFAFVGFYSLAYLFNKKAAHRFVGLIEEEAVKSYTSYLEAVDAGKIANVPAPEMAKTYWNLPQDARLRDVIIAVRNDEAEHRDVNHRLSSALEEKQALRQKAAAEKRQAFFKKMTPPFLQKR
jgi:ubiquinol oxidase